MSSRFSLPAGGAVCHFHRPYKNRASGAHCAGKSLCGQGDLSVRTLPLQLPRLSPGGG
jgi:hypothetical protein